MEKLSAKRQHVVISEEVIQLKNKIFLKKLDREAYLKEQEEKLNSKLVERKALRIGNNCLTNMTHEQLMMPKRLNGEVFEGRKEFSMMERVPLDESIELNDSKLFKCGKRLLKEDCLSKKRRMALRASRLDLEHAKQEADYQTEVYDKQCEMFLHTQAKVEDSKDRENSARVLHHQLSTILYELNKDIQSTPKRIETKRKQIADIQVELNELLNLKKRAEKYAATELELLGPVNREIRLVNEHFASLISTRRCDLDNRRKHGNLAKFLAAREANALSYTDSPNILDAQYRRKAKRDDLYDIINNLKDVTMVSDVNHVVDCFLDQSDLSVHLEREKEVHSKINLGLKQSLKGSTTSNLFLRYDETAHKDKRDRYASAVHEELELIRHLEDPEVELSGQDKLISSLMVAVHAIAEKLRPITLGKNLNKVHGHLFQDMELVVQKTQRMLEVIKNNTVPIGPVKPIMLKLFQEERIPQDSVRGEGSSNRRGSIGSLRSFEPDTPGLISRTYLKQSAADIIHEVNKKKKKGGK